MTEPKHTGPLNPIELTRVSNAELILRMEKLVRTERKVTHLVLLHIAEIESRKIYADLGFDGMYSYLTKGLGYSEGSAYRRLQSSRLLKQVPEVAKKIEDGRLNLTQLTEVQKCVKENTLSSEETLKVLEKLENKNSFETQKTLTFELNLPVQTTEKIKPQADESIRMELTLTKEQFDDLEQAKSLLSHIYPDGSWSDIIAKLAKEFNQQKLLGHSEIGENSKKVSTLASLLENPTQCVLAAGEKPSVKRKSISLGIRRQLLRKAGNCCEFKDPKNGKRCGSKYQLQIDHIQPVAFGGGNDLENLRVLCRTHNLQAARNRGLNYEFSS
ncbi:MAG: HNH endonuclease [Bdellovibrionales bacterium]|nr:HNH endonuclease [Bdellovibrionales bacterium]